MSQTRHVTRSAGAEMATNHSLFAGLEDWVAGQRLALGASLLTAKGYASPPEQTAIFSPICIHPGAPQGDRRERYIARLQELPPAALETLSDLPDSAVGYWREHRSVWTEALDKFRWNGQYSSAAAANLVADRIVSGALTARQIIRLAREELGFHDWERTEGAEPRVDALISSMQSTRLARERIQALARFRQGEVPKGWGMVENAIAQRVLSWPLLVLEGDQAISCTLPMAIEVRPTLPEHGLRMPTLSAGPEISCEGWSSSLRRAWVAAIRLWEHKHGSWSLDFQRIVRSTSVEVDLHLASLIVRPFASPDLFGKFLFEGRSLEAYLALEMLSQMLGGINLGAVSATGALGAIKPNGTGADLHRKGADHYIESLPDLPGLPNRVEEKITCAKRGFVDQIVVPKGSARTGYREHLRVSDGFLFSHFASNALGQEWRHHRYRRCPDLAFRFKANKRYLPSGPSADELRSAFDRIHQSRNAIVGIRDCSPLSVAQALYEINRAAEHDAEKEFTRFAGNERQANFALVRAVPDETDEQFWRTIWDVIGGDTASYRRFCSTRGRVEAARIFAGQLNWLLPTWERRSRAPDVLVIAGARHLDRLRPPARHRPEHLAPMSILEVLHDEGLLTPATNPVVRKHLGRTRIILVEDDRVHRAGSLQGISNGPLRAIRALSVFRFGFTFAMARSLLRVDDADCDWILRNLGRSSDRPGALYFEESSGEYCLDVRVRPDGDTASIAELHHDAACAIIGFLDQSLFPERLEFGQALRPDRQHETRWHLREAARLADLAGDEKLYAGCRAALDRLGPISPPAKIERPNFMQKVPELRTGSAPMEHRL